MGFPIATEIYKAVAAADSIDAFEAVDTAEIADDLGGSGASDSSCVADATDDRAADVGCAVAVDISPVQLATGRWSRWIAVAGGFGYVPVAPGTAGSFAGVLVFWIVGMSAAAAEISGPGFAVLYALVVALLLLLGTHAAGCAEIDFGRRDDGRIVIDEVVGQLVALAPLVPLLWTIETGRATATAFGSFLANGSSFASGLSTQDVSLFISEVVTGFVLFRLFDVWKPGAIRWAERRFHGGLGVMADDVMAGIHAALCLFILHSLVFERFYSEWLIATRPDSSLSWLSAPWLSASWLSAPWLSTSWLGVSGLGVSL